MGHPKEDTSPYSNDVEASPYGSRDTFVVKPITTWKGYVWDTWELPKDQRWLLFKLDAFVLTFASVRPEYCSLPCQKKLKLIVVYICFLDWLLSQEP